MSDEKEAPEPPHITQEQGATEEQMEKIDAIVGDEVLGYEGSGRGEHSGQESEPTDERLSDRLADNRPEQMK
jgi:hypothetical protein